MNTLPLELVLMILERRKDRSGMLRTVCSLWRDLVRSSPMERHVVAESVSVCAWSKEHGLPWVPWVGCLIVYANRIDVIRYAVDNDIPVNGITMSIAAGNGNIEALKLLKPLDSNKIRSGVCDSAAKFGHLEALKWLYANHYYCESTALTSAAVNGHVHVMEWIRYVHQYGEHLVLHSVAGVSVAAAAAGNIESLKWFHDNGYRIYGHGWEHAARFGHLDVLKWAHGVGYKFFESVCGCAANLEMLQWLRSIGCDWSSSVCKNAREIGDDEMLEWAIQNGCPDV